MMTVPTTVLELIKWMQVNCYHFNGYSLNSSHIYEGFGLALRDGTWIWYYTERGQQDVLAHFNTEQEAVAHAFKTISIDCTARTHLIGFMSDTMFLNKLIKALEQRGIAYSQDVIFYSNTSPKDRYRVFVFGCDVNKVTDLKAQYCHFK